MKYLKKILVWVVLLGNLVWISSPLAQETAGQQGQADSVVVPATDAAPSSVPAPAPAQATESAPVAPVAAPQTAPTVPLASLSRSGKDAICTKCHDENEVKPILSIYQTKHGVKADLRTPACQSCHGASDKHVKGDPSQKGRAAPDVVFGSKKSASGGFAPSEAKEQNEACLNCHRNDTKRTHWEGSTHQSRNLACVSCHVVHTAHDRVRDKKEQQEVCFTCHKTERALTHRISTHPINAGEMSCSDCHNPHGSIGPKLLLKASVSETCFTCHTEKRGPFLWEHSPVVEDCLNCHTPHGSNNTPLLKVRAPWLCEQCHQGTGTGHYGYFDANFLPGGGAVSSSNSNNPNANTNPTNPLTGQKVMTTAPNPRVAYRGCVNCHSQIHGSNHPAGSRFVR